jgi:hypothetical protein
MIAYRATLDVSGELAWFAAKLLLAERRRRGTPRGSRALSCFWQAVLGLRWFRDRTAAESPARDHRISRATAYRYLDEVITVLAQQAPDLRRALERAKDEGFSHVILDGKIIPADGAKSPPSASKARSPACGVPARPMPTVATSRPCWPRTDARYGSRRQSLARVHDLTAARVHDRAPACRTGRVSVEFGQKSRGGTTKSPGGTSNLACGGRWARSWPCSPRRRRLPGAAPGGRYPRQPSERWRASSSGWAARRPAVLSRCPGRWWP